MSVAVNIVDREVAAGGQVDLPGIAVEPGAPDVFLGPVRFDGRAVEEQLPLAESAGGPRRSDEDDQVFVAADKRAATVFGDAVIAGGADDQAPEFVERYRVDRLVLVIRRQADVGAVEEDLERADRVRARGPGEADDIRVIDFLQVADPLGLLCQIARSRQVIVMSQDRLILEHLGASPDIQLTARPG